MKCLAVSFLLAVGLISIASCRRLVQPGLTDTCPEGYSKTDPDADIDLPALEIEPTDRKQSETFVEPTDRKQNETFVGCYMEDAGETDLKRALIPRAGYSCRVNDWDSYQTCRCQNGMKISQFGSYHDNHKEDRRWDLKCEDIAPEATAAETNWNSYRTGENWWDSVLHWRWGIANNAFMTGMTSYHDNHREDRRYTIYYSNSPNWVLKDCSGWKQLNGWDGAFTHNLRGNRVISELYSLHNNHREDRLFWIKECSLVPIGPPEE